jgi:hypothetical protein
MKTLLISFKDIVAAKNPGFMVNQKLQAAGFNLSKPYKLQDLLTKPAAVFLQEEDETVDIAKY